MKKGKTTAIGQYSAICLRILTKTTIFRVAGSRPGPPKYEPLHHHWVITMESFNINRGHCTYPQEVHSTFLRSAHTGYLCVSCDYQYKQRFLSSTTVSDWFVQPRWRMFTERCEMGLEIQQTTFRRWSVKYCFKMMLLFYDTVLVTRYCARVYDSSRKNLL